MRGKQVVGSVTALTAILLTGACTDNPSEPLTAAEEQQLNLDVAAYSAEATVDDIDVITAESQAAFGAPAASPPTGDFQLSRQITYYDESGGEMDGYHPSLTEAINMLFSMQANRSRTGDRGSISVQVSRERDVTVSGLLGEETQRTWNGAGSASNNRALRSDAAGDREYDFSAVTQIEDVVIPVPRDGAWPLSGTITRTVTIQIVRGLSDVGTRERVVVVTFNGTNLVPMTINGESFLLNLETREIVDANT